MGKAKKVKVVECWAPTDADGQIAVNYECKTAARPKLNSFTAPYIRGYIRVRITPIPPKPRKRRAKGGPKR